MNKVVNNIKENHKTYLAVLLFIIILYSVASSYSYASDTYYLEAYGYQNNAINPYIKDGRIFMTLFLYTMEFLNISYKTMQVISWLGAVSFLTIGVCFIYNTFKKVTNKDSIFQTIISICLVSSIFVAEFFIFSEYTIIMTLGIMFCCISCFFLIDFFKDKSVKSLIIAFIIGVLTSFTYQGIVSLLVLFPIVFTFYYSKNIKDFIINNASIAGVYAASCITTLVFTKIMGSTRVGSNFDLGVFINKIYEGTASLMVNASGFLPKYMFLIICIVTFCILLVVLLKKKINVKLLMFSIYVYVAIVIVTYVPHIMVDSNSIWIVPRSNIGLGLLPIMAIVIYYLYIKDIKVITKTYTVVLICMYAMFYFNFNSILIDQQKVNYITYIETMKIKDSIQQLNYLGNQIAVFHKENKTYQLPNTKVYGDININPFVHEWSSLAIIHLYLGSNYELVKMSSEMEVMCAKKLENEPNKNHVIIEDGIVNICMM